MCTIRFPLISWMKLKCLQAFVFQNLITVRYHKNATRMIKIMFDVSAKIDPTKQENKPIKLRLILESLRSTRKMYNC